MGDAPTLDQARPRQPAAALNLLAAIVASSDDAIVSANAGHIITTWNPGAELLYGYPASEAIGQPITLLVPPDRSDEWSRLMERLQRGERIEHLETVRRHTDGKMIDISIGVAPIVDAAGQLLGSAAIARDITDRKRLDRELRVRARQQAAVAELSQRALACDHLSTLLDEAVALIAHTLELEHCTILELLPDGTALRFRAGVGWRDGVIGQALVPAGTLSQAGYTLETGKPVLVEDLRKEQRFRPNALLLEHGIVSGISVLIPGQEHPFGVLSMHAREVRPFTADDVHFLEASANVLAAAIKRTSTEEQLREKEAQYRSIFEATSDGIVINDPESGGVVEVNPAYCRMYGYTREEMIGRHPGSFRQPEHLPRRFAEYVQTITAGRTFRARTPAVRKDGTPFHVDALGTLFTFRGKPHLLGLVRDVTEQVQAYESIEQRVAERTQELSTLLEVSHHVAATLELEPLLGLILAQLGTIVDYSAAGIFIVEGDHVRMLDYRGPLPRETMVEVRIPLAQAVGYQAVLRHDGPVIVDDLWDRSSPAEMFQGLPVAAER